MIVLSGSDPIFSLISSLTFIQFSSQLYSSRANRALNCLDYQFYGQAANRESAREHLSTKGAAVTTSYPGVTFARETEILRCHGKRNAGGIATSMDDETSLHRARRSCGGVQRVVKRVASHLPDHFQKQKTSRSSRTALCNLSNLMTNYCCLFYQDTSLQISNSYDRSGGSFCPCNSFYALQKQKTA